jgi:hypothetical protein
MPREQIKKISSKIKSRLPSILPRYRHSYVVAKEQLINAESEIGKTLFGPVPEGHRREFFHHQKNVWIWHESWTEDGKEIENTLRYEVRPHGVYKKQLGGRYEKIVGGELKNFRTATREYLRIVKAKLYS